MSETVWTKEAPKEAGWYWLKFDPEYWPGLPEGVQKPLMVSVYHDGYDWRFQDMVNNEDYLCQADGRLWAGPLTPPSNMKGGANASHT